MNLEQLNELVNRGQVASGLLAVAFILLLIYAKLDSRKNTRQTHK